MRNAFQVYFGLLLGALLVACGSDQQLVSTEVVAVKRDSSPHFSEPGKRRSEVDEKTVLQMVCESSDTKFAMPNSQQALGTRNREFLASSKGRMAAPTLLGVSNRVARILWTMDDQVKWVDYSMSYREEVSERVTVAKSSVSNSALLSRLGLRGAKLAAVSPSGESFVLMAKGRIEFRSVLRPEEKLGDLAIKGQLMSPRWAKVEGGQEIYLDRVSSKDQTQVLVKLNERGELLSQLELPRSRLPFQLGLRRLDRENLIWMEWSEKKQFIRVWNGKTKKTRDYEVPLDWKVGPGFVLSPEQDGQIVMQSSLGLFYGRLVDNRLSLERKLEYLPTVEDNIRRGIFDWKPGQIYSSANDKQVFVVLPTTFGRMIYAVDNGRFFRKLGEESCENPDFYPIYE